MCVLACPQVFLINDDDGHAYVAQEVVAKEYEERVLLAVRGCPEKAIEAFEP
jgi:ferredoxin